MAAGVRIQHPTEKNVTFLIVDGRRPYKGLVACGACNKTHEFKTYHLRLDETGATIVSQEIVARLQELPAMGGFSIANEVAEPPAQRLILSKPTTIKRIAQE
jgi:hypothetical protein